MDKRLQASGVSIRPQPGLTIWRDIFFIKSSLRQENICLVCLQKPANFLIKMLIKTSISEAYSSLYMSDYSNSLAVLSCWVKRGTERVKTACLPEDTTT